ncbi:MAG: hypothetical protein Tsb009_15440 [Planctomycetaceae bacterium]
MHNVDHTLNTTTRIYSIYFVLLVIVVLSVGCKPIGLIDSLSIYKLYNHSDKSAEAEWVNLADKHSLTEIDKELSQRLNQPDAQDQCEQLISGWGKHNQWYDLIVVKFIWRYWANVYGEQHELDYKKLMTLLQSKIREKPELLNQLYWYVQWKIGPWEMPKLCKYLGSVPIHAVIAEGQEFRFLIWVCGLTSSDGDLNSVLSAEWDNLSSSLYISKLEFLAKRPFLIYDQKSGRYKYDEEAAEQSKYVNVEQQHMTPRQTPLPNWIGPVPVVKKSTPVE